MTAMQLLDMLNNQGVRIWEDGGNLHYSAPRGIMSGSVLAELSTHKQDIISILNQRGRDLPTGLPEIIPDPQQRHLPFPLTDLQMAYLIGRDETFELGNIACHIYMELARNELDIDRLNQAWQALIERHDMLKTIILANGTQQILETVSPYQIGVLDLSEETPDVVQFHLNTIRNSMSHQVFKAGEWPLFELRVTRLSEDLFRLHISIDQLIADAFSLQILFRELDQLYANPQVHLVPLDISFRDYVLAEAGLRESSLHERSRRYWHDRLPELPPAPALPLAKTPESVVQPRFTHRSFRLEAEIWQGLKIRASRGGLTPTALLFAAYAEVLSIWSKRARFTINMTLFNRLPMHPGIMDIMGEFTSVSLLEVDYRSRDSFELRAKRLQQQFWDDLDHRYFSGIQVIRELNKSTKASSSAVMPVVFTSAIGVASSGQNDNFDLSKLGEVVYLISQTPQVWLDNQAMEQGQDLVCSWDAVEELFPEGLLDDMFSAYHRLLRNLAREEEAWQKTTRDLVPSAQINIRTRVNATDGPVSDALLHTLFAACVPKRQHQAAVITADHTLSYGELSDRSSCLGALLREKGTKPNRLVAVVMQKGWEQIVAVLGILHAGAAYLPIDPAVPKARLWYLLNDGEVSFVLTQSWLDETLEWPENVQRFCVDKIELDNSVVRSWEPIQNPEDLAYVIYTSGSTGWPKGVMIDHRGAVNTILEINRRFKVGVADRVLALSNLNFDLSVYDIFGMLAAGGTIVLPDADKSKDPVHWLDLITNNQITVWNSVPALMQMLEEYLSGRTDAVSQSLRLILLSGDWIPLDLPDKIKRHFNGVQAIGLGGATEASIWSNLYPIEKVDPDWKSIPYGYPMLNQQYHVFNEFMEDCPDWVPGQLYIGGLGLAKGYWRDEEKTKNSFIVCPQTGERLYRTGDYGRYLPDGSIEFLGRKDFQIKINGYRIEPGEIETTLKRLPGVKDAVVAVTDEVGKEKQLVGYVVPNNEKESILFESKQVDSARCASRWESVKNAGQGQASQIPGSMDTETVLTFINSVEHLSFVIMCQVFHEMGIFSREGEEYSINELMRRFKIQPRFHTLLLHWLDVLKKEGVLKKTKTGSYLNCCSLNKEKIEFSSKLSKNLATLYSSLQHHIPLYVDLLKGNIDPVELLHSEDTFLTAERLEQMAPGREYYLNLASRLFSTIIDSCPLDKKVQVLEVGTRAGNLTDTLLSLLPTDQGCYYYTDASSVFTDKMREKLGDIFSFECSLFDMNKAPKEQGYEPYSFDVIVADKTLHRANHLEITLKYVKELLVPGGLLFLIEPTQNNRLILITVGFFEDGFAHFEDERKVNQLPFFPVKKWRGLLEKTGFSKIMAFPEDGHAAETFGQHLIVAQAPETVKVFDPSNIVAALRQKLPVYMVPVRYTLLDKLPLSANLKIDRKALAKFGKKTKQIAKEVYVAPINEIQIKIASVWEEMLGYTRVGIHDNFFELGGDSLRAIQCINLLKEVYRVDLSLQEFFEEANVERLAKKIEERLGLEKSLKIEEGEI